MAGRWTLDVDSPQGATKADLVLAVEGEAVTGTIGSDMGESKFTGTVKDGTVTFTFDMAGRITKAFEPLADVDGIYAYDLELKCVLDPGWSSGRGLVATLINTLAAL